MSRFGKRDDRSFPWAKAERVARSRDRDGFARGGTWLGRAWMCVRCAVNAAVEHRIALELETYSRRYGPN